PAGDEGVALDIRLKKLSCAHHGMTRSETLRLINSFKFSVQVFIDLIRRMTLDHAYSLYSRVLAGIGHPREHRLAQHLEQYLWLFRIHSFSCPAGKYYSIVHTCCPFT